MVALLSFIGLWQNLGKHKYLKIFATFVVLIFIYMRNITYYLF